MHGNACGVEVVKALNIDSKMVRRDPLLVERVDAAYLTEEVRRCTGVKQVLGERGLASKKLQLSLAHLDHPRILAATDRVVAYSELREVNIDLEARLHHSNNFRGISFLPHDDELITSRLINIFLKVELILRQFDYSPPVRLVQLWDADHMG
jgi:hypothetical protein